MKEYEYNSFVEYFNTTLVIVYLSFTVASWFCKIYFNTTLVIVYHSDYIAQVTGLEDFNTTLVIVYLKKP